jgi:hypothetical protein
VLLYPAVCTALGQAYQSDWADLFSPGEGKRLRYREPVAKVASRPRGKPF